MNLPALNWEQPAVQLLMEAYFFMTAVSYPKRIESSRYGQIPIGNLGDDEFRTIYDVSLSRQLVKSRALSWANPTPKKPDLGVPLLGAFDDIDFVAAETEEHQSSMEDIWGEDEDLVSPVIRKPGSYRSVCIELDVHDLAIAALTDANEVGVHGPTSPNSVTMLGSDNTFQKTGGPLGDEMATSISLPLLRVVIASWLKDAFEANCRVADDILHHIYRLVSSPDALMSDPALHRAVHSMMKTTFLRLLAELQRLGCTIILGSFHKVTVATNKSTLTEAEEYIGFVLSTIGNRSSMNGSAGVERVALRPRRYYSQVLLFDEYNFGGIELEKANIEDSDDESNLIVEDGVDGTSKVFVRPSVVSGWSMRNYLGSESAQEYFRAIVARFSKDIFRKENQLRSMHDRNGIRDELLEYKKKVISRHFASDLSRAVDDIVKEGGGKDSFPVLPGARWNSTSPPLEFIKSVAAVLELDQDVQQEVQALRRGLLAQIGVAEYSKAAEWTNPCASFILSDLFCVECHESRDVNLCELPPLEGNSVPKRHWACSECGTMYDPEVIEDRLIDIAKRNALRYQLQDVRCSKTNRVATRALSKQSQTSSELKLDIGREETVSQLELLRHLAQHHELDWLEDTIDGLLSTFEDE
jgi:DNA polymerase epsilon subunit 1